MFGYMHNRQAFYRFTHYKMCIKANRIIDILRDRMLLLCTTL
nr:MAG TPA: hypothetical protein [Caudoviricetes sp.]